MVLALTIGKLAKAGGVNIQTIRYYERRKLLRPKAKKPSGYRLYDDEALKNAQTLMVGCVAAKKDGRSVVTAV
jgi:MerR family mercuric resistance operon transcriptional regulator/MerR family gold-responsive transcriptional activator of gol and ges genes